LSNLPKIKLESRFVVLGSHADHTIETFKTSEFAQIICGSPI
jgi:hypothetical protein